MRHASLAFYSSFSCVLCIISHWLVDETNNGLSQGLGSTGVGGVVFAFHDRVEVGPRMPAQLAKATGLKPEDLQVEFLTPSLLRKKKSAFFRGGGKWLLLLARFHTAAGDVAIGTQVVHKGT